LRAALAWCEEASEPDLALGAASLLSCFWILRGYVDEGRRRLTALLATTGGRSQSLRSEGLRVIGSLALHQAEYATAWALFDESERTAENHVQHVLSRLDLRSRAQVAGWAVQYGLLQEAGSAG